MERPEFHTAFAAAPTIRRAELGRIRAFTQTAQEGVLLVAAGPGLGKSRLLDSIDAGMAAVIHRIRINPAEAALPQSGLSAILAAFRTPEAISLSERLLSQPPGLVQPAAQASELLTFFHRATTTAALLLIDDIDLMDETSQAVIAMVAARLGGSQLRLICTVSEVPLEGPLASLPHMGLAPLAFDDSLQWLSEIAGPQADEAVLRMVSTASNGNPGALMHNLRALTKKELEGNAPMTFPFRPPRHPTVTDDTATGPASANRRALLAQISCARLTSYEAIVLRTGNPARALESLLGDGTVLRQGSYLRIRDPLLRSRVYWALDAASRAEYHATAASAEDPREPGLASWHRSWLDTSLVSSDELLQAATNFTDRGFVGQGTELAERAIAIDFDTTIASDTLVDLAQAMFLRGELARAERYARIIQQRADTTGSSPRLNMLRARIEFMSTQRLPTTSSDDLFAPRDDETTDEAAYALATIAIYHAERWEVDAAKESLARARQMLRPTASDAAEKIALAAMLIAALEGNSAPTMRLFDKFSHHGPAETTAENLVLLGQSLTFLHEHDGARKVFKTIIELEPALDSIWLETTKYALAENEVHAGNQLEALATIDLLNGSNSGTQLHRNVHRLLMSWYWQATGDQAAAEAAIAECHSSFATGDNLALNARLECYRGRFALVEGRLDEAIAFLKSTAAYAASLRIPILLGYQVDLIEAYVLCGRLREAAEAFQEFRARSMPYRTRWTMLAAARAGALVSLGESSIGAFQQAIKLWHPGDSRFELGRLLLSYGDRLTDLGRTREGREQYLQARIIFTEQGATSWAARADSARTDREDAAAEHPFLAALTTEERLVAALACRGLRNKEIAAELFISLRTVEVRLTRIYHKLNVRSRANMIAMLSNLDTSESTGVPWGAA